MATSYFSISTQARIDVSGLVVPFSIDAADINFELDYDYPSFEFSAMASASAMPNVVPFRVAEPARVDVSALVPPLTLTTVPALLVDYDYPAFEFETSTVIYPDVDLIEFDFPSLEMEFETGEGSRRKAKLMIIQVL